MKCHAKLKSGEMCGAYAGSVIKGMPVCDRAQHYYGNCDFYRMTEQSVYPDKLENVLVVVGFRAGKSVAQLAIEYKKDVASIEMILRMRM